VSRASQFARPFRVKARSFSLDHIDPRETGAIASKEEAVKWLNRGVARLAIRKFFLHVSQEEQKRRLLDRLDRPEKNWKFSADDAQTRNQWKPYMKAYEDAIRETSTPYAPWYVVPADHKWFTRLVVVAAAIDALEEMDLAFPRVRRGKRKQLAIVRAALEGDARGRAGT
jgi:hypothetical protein